MDIRFDVEGVIVDSGSPATRVIVLQESEDDGLSLIGWKATSKPDQAGIRFLCRFPTETDLADFMRLSKWRVQWS